MPGKAPILLFDAFGTLFDVSALVHQCQLFWGNKAGQVVATWRDKQLQYTWLRALMGHYADFTRVTEEALRFACQAHRVTLSREQLDTLMEQYQQLPPFPEADAVLQSLSTRPCAILSNGTPEMLQALVERAGWGAHFQVLLSAQQVQTYKPDPRVYRLAITHFGQPIEDYLFISANAWDVAGASAAGFTTCWINRKAQPAETLPFAPNEQLPDLRSLPEIVKKILQG